MILLMLLIWGGANLLLDARRRRRDAALARGVTASVSAEATEEAAALRDRLTNALGLLKKTLRSRGYLYEQPWYAIIGPPGAGKTTALLNSGLQFPLAGRWGGGGRGRRRHAALRLVVHRGCRADRHGRALHHPGFERGGRPRRMGRIPGSAEADQAAAAVERPHHRLPLSDIAQAPPPNAWRMRFDPSAHRGGWKHISASGCPSMSCSPRRT